MDTDLLRDYLLVLRRLTTVLDHLNIEYAVGGSVASSVHGVHRATNDVDFVIRMTPEQIHPLVADLQRDFYVDSLSIQDAIETTASFSIVHLATVIKADFFLSPAGSWEVERWKRAHPANLSTNDNPLIVRVCAAEDMILQKLIWYRLGGQISDRQWADVVGMLKVQAQRIERPYLMRWAEQLGLTEMLERAFAEASIDATT
jgi:hypothetical protein